MAFEHKSRGRGADHKYGSAIKLDRMGYIGFFRDCRAIAAVEFALIAPILLLVYMAGTEIAMAYTIKRKVEHTANSVNDLVTQVSDISKAELDAVFAISSAILTPYDSAKLNITVTAIRVDSVGKAVVDWSRSRGGNANEHGADFKLPADFSNLRSQSLLVASTTYGYLPLGGYGVLKPFEMGGTSYLTPRFGTVKCTDCSG